MMAVRHLCLLVILSMTVSCGDSDTPSTSPKSPIQFVESAESSGLRFHTSHGGSGQRLFMEISAGGVALFDCDDDGDLDVYLTQGAPTSGYEGRRPLTNALFLNDGKGHFEDATDASGLGDTGYGCGPAIGDIDSDGDLDLFVANYGQDQLFRNRGDGTFERITELSDWGDPVWSSSAAFLDYDLDGDLDLYVCHYVVYDAENPPICQTPEGLREYCDPADFPGVRDSLFRNEGEGRFVDVSEDAGIDDKDGRGFGVTVGDFDDDGDPDIYVANDQNRNNLYRNNGDGTFSDIGLFSGVGYGVTGGAEAGMGCDFGDFDGDLKLDLIVTNFSDETNSLYRNLGDELFADETYSRGVGAPTAQPLAFGTAFFDADNDGDLDLYFANGHVLDTIERHDKGHTFAQKDLILENQAGTYADISPSAGNAFSQLKVGRAAAFGDLDDDGDIDIVVTHVDDTVGVYRNDQSTEHNAILLDLRDKEGSPAIGARVFAQVGKSKIRRDVHGAASFQSHNDLRLHVGLGKHTQIDGLEIFWPDGTHEVLETISGNQIVTIRQGEGVGTSRPFGN